MPPTAPDASDRDDAEARVSKGRPGKLTRTREERLHDDPELREQILAATLVVCGERGYRQLTVQKVLDSYGGHRVQFYRQFANADEAYVLAHATHLRRLERRLLEAGASGPSWRAGLRAALDHLGRFAREQPVLGRGLLLEVHVAGDPALGQRQKVLERLSRALDSARRETESRHSPPPLTADFMVSAIESSVVRALVKGDPAWFERAIPELEQIASAAYFGREVRGT